MMKVELQSAANFLVHLIRLGRKHTGSEAQLEGFRAAVVEVLRRRYRDHWFPEKPFKGSGYRCIRINGRMDPILAQAAESVGMPSNTIHQTFPSELTMWVDPLEVSYRIGENGSICVLYEYTDVASSDAWKPTSSGITSGSTTTTTTSSSSSLSSKAAAANNNSSVSSSPVKNHHIGEILPKSTPTSPYHNHHNSSSNNNNQIHRNNVANSTAAAMSSSKKSACKESLYKIDCLLDPRKSASFDQLAAFVSS